MILLWCNGFPEIYAWLEEGVGLICHGYMCIVIYMKLIWCNGFPEIYAWLEEGCWSAMGICTLCYIWNLFVAMVFQWSMLDWRGVLICHRYMCIVLYMKLIWCDGFQEISAQLEEGVGSICHGYMCIVLYMKLIWCTGFQEIYAGLEEGWGQSAMAFYYMWNCFGVWVCHGICALCTMWDLWGVMVLHGSMGNWQGRCNGVAWIYGQLAREGVMV